jgi:hypothetical protein
MECPICKYPVLADGSTCRRCGAPLHVPIIEAKVPGRTALLGKRTPGARSTVESSAAPPAPAAPETHPSPAARAAAHLKHTPADAMLPGAFSRRDNLLPRATRASGGPPVRAVPESPAPTATVRVAGYTVPIVGAHAPHQRSGHDHSRRRLMTGAAAAVAAIIVIAACAITFGGHGSSPLAGAAGLNQSRATDLLRSVVGSARGAYASDHAYTSLTPSSLSARTHGVPVVGPSTVAHGGTVSMHVNATAVVTFASPADARRCVFARDNAARNSTVFITVSTSDCRAAAAPDAGWRAR